MTNFSANKKGQATRTAVLIIVITALILLYILFLPPAERAKLLDESTDDDSDTVTEADLLVKNPGRLDYLKDLSLEYSLPSFNLYSTTGSALLKDFSSVYVKKSLFSEEKQNLDFTIEDYNQTKNVKLSFKKDKSKGRLLIKINDEPLYQQYVDKTYPDAISIPAEELREGINTLEFSVSSPGLLFFITNEYSLSDIKITADVTDVSKLQNKQVFFIREQERTNLDYATLTFMTNCKTRDTGELKVFVNYQSIYEGVPECSMPVKITISKDNIISGENRLRFLSSGGSYIIDRIIVRTYLKEPVYTTYYFEINDEDYSDILSDDLDVNMSLVLVADEERGNDLEVEINGHKFTVETDEEVFDKIIDMYIRKGNNAITLRPLHGAVEVIELKIRTQEK